MKGIGFKITEKISYQLDKLCMYIVKDGSDYNKHKTAFHLLDNLSSKVYSFGYNTFVLGAK